MVFASASRYGENLSVETVAAPGDFLECFHRIVSDENICPRCLFHVGGYAVGYKATYSAVIKTPHVAVSVVSCGWYGEEKCASRVAKRP